LKNALLKSNQFDKDNFKCIINDTFFDDSNKKFNEILKTLNEADSNQTGNQDDSNDTERFKPKYFVQLLENLVSFDCKLNLL
jgi:hypothetical protein